MPIRFKPDGHLSETARSFFSDKINSRIASTYQCINLILQERHLLGMFNKLVQFIFFGNYFVGLLTIALALETAFQLQLPFNSPAFYALAFMVVVLYYTYAYSGVMNPTATNNPRTLWYRKHFLFVRISQWTLLAACGALGLWYIIHNFDGILLLPVYYWLILAAVTVAGLLYYGIAPHALAKFNLRNSGLLKAFVIGFVWACWVDLVPVIALRIERHIDIPEPGFLLWSFIKNWMFCTVNAIMFDIKDYADDSNRQLKTFVVRMGLRKTIFYLLLPLLIIGVLSLIVFASYRHFGLPTMLLNLIPFACLIWVAYSLHNRKPILYYLVVIDGLLLLKAICGILGALVRNV